MTFDEAQNLLDTLNGPEVEEMDAALFGATDVDFGDAPEWFFLTPGMES